MNRSISCLQHILWIQTAAVSFKNVANWRDCVDWH